MKPFEFIDLHIALPPRAETAEQLSVVIQRDVQWIEQNAGVSRRYVSNLGDDPTILAAAAARPLVERHGSPDLLIYASASIRQCLPDSSVFVSRALGLSGVPSFSVNATCLSFLVALQQGAALIAAGDYQKILIVSAELPSLSRNFEEAESAALFGDGGAATLIAPTKRIAGMEHFQMTTWPEFADLTQVRGGGLLNHPELSSTTVADYRFAMDGKQLLRAALPRLRKFLKEFFLQSGVDPNSIALLVPHQPSQAGMQVYQHLGFPADRTINILKDYGNCVSASIPMALTIAHQQQRLHHGDRVLLLGTAAGLSVGAAILKW